MSGASFQVVDYVVFGLTILVSVMIGIYYAIRGRGRNSTSHYILAGGKMAPLPVALSLVVTYESSIFVLGYPAEVYIHGFMFWFYNVGFLLGLMFVTRVSPRLFHPLPIKSVYEYLSLRYGEKKIRMLAVCLTILSMTIYMGVVLFGPAIALRSVTAIPEWVSILALGTIAILYTSIGGLKAVIWTDVFQCTVIVAGVLAVIIKGIMESGGVSNVVRIGIETGRLDVQLDPNPMIRHSVWTLVIGEFARVIYISFSQATVQRLKSTASVKGAKRVLYIATPCFVILQSLVMIEGLVAFAYFSVKGCDPLAARQIEDPNEIVPFMVLDMFGSIPGVSGLFLAALCCASLSTISSMLSSISAIVVEDLVKPVYGSLSDQTFTGIAKLAVPVAGALGICIAFMAKTIGGPMSQINVSIGGAIESPLTAIFLLSVFVPMVTSAGVFWGGLVGIVFCGWLSTGYSFSQGRLKTPWLPLGPTHSCPNSRHYGNGSYPGGLYGSFTEALVGNNATMMNAGMQQETASPEGIDWLYSISYQYFGLLGVCVTLVMGVVISLLTRRFVSRYRNREPVDPRYKLSLHEVCLCCFPACLRSRRYFRSDVTRVSQTQGSKARATTAGADETLLQELP